MAPDSRIGKLLNRTPPQVGGVYDAIYVLYQVDGTDKRAEFERIDLHLIRVLLTLISERSVSRAAVQLQSTPPAVSAQLKRIAPRVRLELEPLTDHFDYRRSLANGEVDLVIGNWLEPPAELHLGPLLTDQVVCLVAKDHSVADAKAANTWTVEQYLANEHVAPMPLHPGAIGVIDEHLSAKGLNRNIVVRSPHFGLIPMMVSDSRLVMTTGRLFCSRYEHLPVKIIKCPVPFPPLIYYQLWHDLTHRSPSMKWFRDQFARSPPI